MSEVSVYAAVLNERTTIGPLLKSLLAQTLPPDEILVVDGGSTDGTTDVVREYAKKDERIRLVVAPKTNIAQARNVALANARHDLIASIDGGCVARIDWLEELLFSMKKDVDIVSGVYAADPASAWEGAVADFFYPDPDRLPSDWNQPSHRSILVRRRAYELVGPFPERLFRSEDSWFNAQASRLGLRFRLARNAAVYWKPRQNLREVFTNSYLWVKSDLENDVNRAYEKNRAIRITLRLIGKVAAFLLWLLVAILNPLSGVLTLPLLIFHLIKISHKMRSTAHFFWHNGLDYTIMVASAAGLFAGELGRIRQRVG